MGGPEYLEAPAETDLYYEMPDLELTVGGHTAPIKVLAAFCPEDVSRMTVETRNGWLVEQINLTGATIPAHLEETVARVSDRKGLEHTYRVAEPDIEKPTYREEKLASLAHKETVSTDEDLVQSYSYSASAAEKPGLTIAHAAFAEEQNKLIQEELIAVRNDGPIVAVAQDQPVRHTGELSPEPIVIATRLAEYVESKHEAAPLRPIEQVVTLRDVVKAQPVLEERVIDSALVMELPAPVDSEETDINHGYLLGDTIEESIPVPGSTALLKMSPDKPFEQEVSDASAAVLLEAISQPPQETLIRSTEALELYIRQAEQQEAASVAPIVYEVVEGLRELDDAAEELVAPLMQNLLGALHGLELLLESGDASAAAESLLREVEALCAQLLDALHIDYEPADIQALIAVLRKPEFAAALQLVLDVEKVGTHEMKLFKRALHSASSQVDENMRSLLGKVALLPHRNPLMVR